MGRKSNYKVEDILQAIEQWDNQQLPLTVKRLADHMHTSKTNMHYHLRCLRRDQRVDWMDNIPGTLHVIKPAAPVAKPAEKALPSPHLIHIPLIAEIPAGELSDALGENGTSYHPDWVSLDLNWLQQSNIKNLYALKVVGDSMKDAQIHNGDVVVIQPVCQPQNGDIVAAKVGPEVTLKYYHEDNGTVTLRPANPLYSDKSYPREAVRIEGKAIFAICPTDRTAPDYGPLID